MVRCSFAWSWNPDNIGGHVTCSPDWEEDGEGFLSCISFSNLFIIITDPTLFVEFSVFDRAGTSVVTVYTTECCPWYDGYLIKFSIASSITLRLLVLVLVLSFLQWDPAVSIKVVPIRFQDDTKVPKILNATTSRPRDYFNGLGRL